MGVAREGRKNIHRFGKDNLIINIHVNNNVNVSKNNNNTIKSNRNNGKGQKKGQKAMISAQKTIGLENIKSLRRKLLMTLNANGNKKSKRNHENNLKAMKDSKGTFICID